MHIMFTDKLSKMVASALRKFDNMISSDMIFKIEQNTNNLNLFWQNTSWTSGEERNQYHRPTSRKNPECNSNDINSRNEVRSSS